MKKLFKSLCIISFICCLFCLVSCNKRSNGTSARLPKDIEEAEALLKQIPDCDYQIESVEDYYDAPDGALYTIMAEHDNDYDLLLVIKFDSASSARDALDYCEEIIYEAAVYEYGLSSSDIEIKSNGKWIYGGTENFISYFEGKTDVDDFK